MYWHQGPASLLAVAGRWGVSRKDNRDRNMSRCYRVMSVCVLAFFCLSSPTQAQSQRPGATNPTAGIWYRGKFCGYDPLHQNHPAQTSQRAVQVRPSSAQRSASVADAQTAAIPASFAQEPAEEPPASSSVTVDGADDTMPAEMREYETRSPCYWAPRVWGGGEYLLGWTKGMNVPALATTGVLGQAGTTVLFGDSGVDDEASSGGRFTVGLWLDPCCCTGISATYLKLGRETESFAASQDDFANLAHPFLNLDPANTGQDARLIASPGVVQGTLDIATSTEFQSLEALFRWAAKRDCCSQIDWLLGYRFLELQDRVRIDESTLSLSGPTQGATIDLFDQFDTQNTFHGAEFGLSMKWRPHPLWSYGLLAKVALGRTNSQAAAAGQTITTDSEGTRDETSVGLLRAGDKHRHARSEPIRGCV